jgi:amidase
MVKDPFVDSVVVEHDWQGVARRKQADREANLAKFADWRIEVQLKETSDVSQLPLKKLTDRERNIVNSDATALADLIRKRLYTSEEVLMAYAKAAVVAQDAVNCLTEIFIEEALDRARELDKYLEVSGNVVGPLHGKLDSIFFASASGSRSVLFIF